MAGWNGSSFSSETTDETTPVISAEIRLVDSEG